MSQLLPYFLKEERGSIAVYFTRVFNPVYTYPDGFSWIEALTDTDKIGLHVALTPTWNETAYFADYVLPMGHSPERHDIQSQETHAATWVTYRQPVLREYAEREGEEIERTYEANPGEVWEEDEFWLDLSWQIRSDGELGIRQYFVSPYRDGDGDEPAQMTVEEYYQYVFEHEEELVDVAEEKGMTPLEYMKHHGAFEASQNDYELHEEPLDPSILDENGVFVDEYGTSSFAPKAQSKLDAIKRGECS
jgi:anaerobic selenocysteine-containing dehydrogenase